MVWAPHSWLASPKFGRALRDRYEALGVTRITMMAATGEIVAARATEQPYETMTLPSLPRRSWEALLDEAARLRGYSALHGWTERVSTFEESRERRDLGAVLDPSGKLTESCSLRNDCEVVLFARKVQAVEPVHVPFVRLDWAI